MAVMASLKHRDSKVVIEEMERFETLRFDLLCTVTTPFIDISNLQFKRVLMQSKYGKDEV
jgi:hypothetical protein